MTNAVSRPSLLFALCVLFAGFAAQGQTAAPDPPRFFLETITVENTESVSPEIVISESLLGPGMAYTETQLRAAVHRISRLPFILDADFRLEKGAARDSYELVITVYETRKWFFGMDAVYTRRQDPSIFADEEEFEVSRTLAGRRFSIGKYGVLFAAFNSFDEAFSIGYTHYNLGGRGIILDTSYALDSWSSSTDAHRLSGRVIVPLRTNQSLRFSTDYLLERSRVEPFTFEGLFEDLGTRRSWSTEAAWTYNSLDDPVFSSSGLLAEGAVVYASASQDFYIRFTDDNAIVTENSGENTSKSWGIRLQAQHYWPVTRRTTLFAGIESSLLRTDTESFGSSFISREVDVWANQVKVGHAMFLLSQRSKDSWRELRWETEAQVTFRDQNPSTGGEVTSGILSTGLAYRNGWGVFRLVALYVDPVL